MTATGVERKRFEGGCIVRGGVAIVPGIAPYFVQGQTHVLHFREDCWRAHNCAYPEVAPVRSFRPIDVFCFPERGEYELFRREGQGEIEFRVFLPGIIKRLALEWILPPADGQIRIYRAFMKGI